MVKSRYGTNTTRHSASLLASKKRPVSRIQLIRAVRYRRGINGNDNLRALKLIK